MKTSQNGALILSAKGVDTTKQRIAKAFGDARDGRATFLVPSKTKSERITVEKRERSLQEKAAPLKKWRKQPGYLFSIRWAIAVPSGDIKAGRFAAAVRNKANGSVIE